MRTKAEAEAFLTGTEVFETRAEVWRAILEYNPKLHEGRDIDQMTSRDIDALLIVYADDAQIPCKLQWKHPLKDHEFSVSATHGPQVGFRAHCDMRRLTEAGHRLHKRILAGKFKTVSVVRHYHVISGMVPEQKAA